VSDTPEEKPAALGWWKKYGSVLTPLLASLAAAVVGSVLTYLHVPPAVVERVTEVIKEVPVPGAAEPTDYSPVGGWVRDPDAIAANLDPAVTEHFDRTPAGRAVLGDDDVFLWQAVRKVNNRGPPKDNWYPNVNQQSVGCCVGCGWKHSADIVQATAILSGAVFEWKPVSVEVIYANSRVDIGGGRISGDGSNGSWAKAAVEKDGLAAMAKYGSADLSTFSPARARDWGRRGVPQDVGAAAKIHPVKGCALVKSWADVKRAIGQGYPVAVCSDQGFAMQRDATGRARPQGTWAHCMCVCGVRGARDGRTEGAFILNSWGDSAHTGPVWPADAPVAGFWADAAVVERMVRQGDSFALADVAGFPKRVVPVDWFIRAGPARGAPDRFAHFLDREVPLSW
jgi:hypothetical protein